MMYSNTPQADNFSNWLIENKLLLYQKHYCLYSSNKIAEFSWNFDCATYAIHETNIFSAILIFNFNSLALSKFAIWSIMYALHDFPVKRRK